MGYYRSCLSRLVVILLVQLLYVSAEVGWETPGQGFPEVPTEYEQVTDNRLHKIIKYSEYAGAAYCPSSWEVGSIVAFWDPAHGHVASRDEAVVVWSIERRKLIGSHYRAFIAVPKNDDTIIVAFRGARGVPGERQKTRIKHQNVPHWCDICTVQRGYYEQWPMFVTRLLRDKGGLIDQVQANPGRRIMVVGHETGGTLAAIAAAELRMVSELQVPVHGVRPNETLEMVSSKQSQPSHKPDSWGTV